MKTEPQSSITFEILRSRGFRLWIPFGNYEPHMRIEINREHDSHLEIGRCGMRECDWAIWIVSEMAQRYGKFCFLRGVWTIEQVAAVYKSLTDNPLPEEAYDPDQFHEALARTTAIVKAHWDKLYTAQEMRTHFLMPR